MNPGFHSTRESLVTLQRMHGYTDEELRVILAPMARAGSEPIGSMGTDTPLAVLSDKPRLIFDYFTQLFAQVTNPPLDAIREELVTSLGTVTGPEQNLLEPIPASCRQIVLPFPVINDNDLAKIVHINDEGNLPGLASHVVDGRYDPRGGGDGLRARLADICAEVSAAIEDGARLIILSDRAAPRPDAIPIPSLLLTGAVHHHLIKQKSRTRAGLVVEAGDVRECHHVALLVGLRRRGGQPLPGRRVGQGPGPARGAGGRPEDFGEEGRGQPAQGPGQGPAEDHVQDGGVDRRLLHRRADLRGHRPGPGGDRDLLRRHHLAAVRRGFRPPWPRRSSSGPAVALSDPAGMEYRRLATGGEYQWRRDGEPHLFSPETVFKLQHATRSRRYEIFKEYTSLVDDQSRRLMTLRGLLRIRGVDAGTGEPRPVPINEVEPAARASSGGSPPGPCPTARSRPRRTRRWPSP